jgi:hypothetical protein
LRYDDLTGKYWGLKDETETPTVWGYESEDDAWKVIDEQIIQDEVAEAEAYNDDYRCVDSGREDFHADG